VLRHEAKMLNLSEPINAPKPCPFDRSGTPAILRRR